MSQITEQVSSHGVNKQSWGKRSDDWWSFTSQYLKVRRVRILTLREIALSLQFMGLKCIPASTSLRVFHSLLYNLRERMPRSWNSAVRMPTRNPIFFCCRCLRITLIQKGDFSGLHPPPGKALKRFAFLVMQGDPLSTEEGCRGDRCHFHTLWTCGVWSLAQ